MVYLKSAREVEQIRQACKIFQEAKAYFTIERLLGKSLTAIDQALKQFIESKGATCAFHKYQNFPGFNCLSLNETVIHGIADNRVFGVKDKLTLDIGINLNGYICDAAFTVLGPKAPEPMQTLLEVTEACFTAVVEPQLRPNNPTGNVSHAMQTYFESKGYYLLKQFGGHGCGIKVHEEPLILNYGKPDTGTKLEPGMVLCIEPMVMTDSDAMVMHNNSWNVLTPKSRYNCHVEQMYVITTSGFECLTN